MEHRLDTELDRPDDREEPCEMCGDSGSIIEDCKYGNIETWFILDCPACKGVKDE
jgi:hypothetical protein